MYFTALTAADALRAQCDNLQSRLAGRHRREQVRELMNLAYAAGGWAKSSHDHNLQRDWAAKTEGLLEAAFGIGVSLRFVGAENTERPSTGAVWNPLTRTIDARLMYLQHLIDSVDTIPIQEDFEPTNFTI